jgi:hypothetical protein
VGQHPWLTHGPASSLSLMRFGTHTAAEPPEVTAALAPYRRAATLEPVLRPLLRATLRAYLDLPVAPPRPADHEMRITLLIGWADAVRAHTHTAVLWACLSSPGTAHRSGARTCWCMWPTCPSMRAPRAWSRLPAARATPPLPRTRSGFGAYLCVVRVGACGCMGARASPHYTRARPCHHLTDGVCVARDRQGLEAGKPADANEVVLHDATGQLYEGLSSNFFVVVADPEHGDCIVTAPEDAVLTGTLQQVALRLAPQVGLRVARAFPRTDEVRMWKGAFLTSTSRLVLPIECVRMGTDAAAPTVRLPLHPKVDRLRDLVREDLSVHSTVLL